MFGSNNLLNSSGVLDPSWECFIDGISIGAAAPFQFQENNWLFCSQNTLVDGPHVLTVNATVLKKQTFWLDYIEYVPSASVPLDGKAILIDNLDPQVEAAFGSGWGALGSTANMTGQTNSAFTFNFTGKCRSEKYLFAYFQRGSILGVSLSWYGFIPTELPHSPATGSYSVDNGTPTSFLLKGLSTSATTTVYNQNFFTTPNFTQGQHEITVLFEGTGQTTPLTLDYMVIQNGTTPVTTTTGSGSTATTSSSSSPALTSNNSTGGKGNTGIIVGAVIGGLVLIALTILAVFFIRRRDKKLRHEEKLAPSFEPQPFLYSPVPITTSVLDGYRPGAGLPSSKQPGRGGEGAGYGHNQMPSFSLTDASHSVDPPSTAPASAATIPSTVNTVGHQPGPNAVPVQRVVYAAPSAQSTSTLSRSEKERREADATATALQPQRRNDGDLPSPPLSTDSVSSRVLMHEDSGVRLRGNQVETILEIPPKYTAG